jgi:hypothetical protein
MAVFVTLSFGQALHSTAALLIRAALPGAPAGAELGGLLAAAPLELVLSAVPGGLSRRVTP